MKRDDQKIEAAVFDRCVFFLHPDEHEKFIELLDSSVRPSESVRKRLNRKPLWER